MRTFKTLIKPTEDIGKAKAVLGDIAKQRFNRSGTLPPEYADAAIKHGEKYYDYR